MFANNVHDRCEEFLRMPPDVDVADSPLFAECDTKQPFCWKAKSHHAERALACVYRLVMPQSVS